MAKSLRHDLADELGLLDLNRDNDSIDEEEVPAAVDQEFSIKLKTELIPVQVVSVISPNRLVIKSAVRHSPSNPKYVSDAEYINLSSIYNEFKCNEQIALNGVEQTEEARKRATYELYSKNKHVIVNTMIWSKANNLKFDGDDVDDSDSEDDAFHPDSQLSTGVILSCSPKNMKYQVFVCNMGIISNCYSWDMCPLPPGHDFLLENPSFTLVTIPGIVPRKRMDSIPGLAAMNFQDREWSKGALKDVQNWLSQYKVVLLSKLIQKSPSVLYGDFYGVKDSETKEVHKDDLLSTYLTRQKNVFFNYQQLNRSYETND